MEAMGILSVKDDKKVTGISYYKDDKKITGISSFRTMRSDHFLLRGRKWSKRTRQWGNPWFPLGSPLLQTPAERADLAKWIVIFTAMKFIQLVRVEGWRMAILQYSVA